jgi:AraC family transcriptional regulator
MDVQPLWKRVPEFFEKTGYEHADSPELEQFSHNKTHRFGGIWVPIIKK